MNKKHSKALNEAMQRWANEILTHMDPILPYGGAVIIVANAGVPGPNGLKIASAINVGAEDATRYEERLAGTVAAFAVHSVLLAESAMIQRSGEAELELDRERVIELTQKYTDEIRVLQNRMGKRRMAAQEELTPKPDKPDTSGNEPSA